MVWTSSRYKWFFYLEGIPKDSLSNPLSDAVIKSGLTDTQNKVIDITNIVYKGMTPWSWSKTPMLTITETIGYFNLVINSKYINWVQLGLSIIFHHF